MIATHAPERYAVDELFDRLGTHLMLGLGYTLDGQTPSAHVSPLYPVVLATVYTLVGHRPEWLPYLHLLFDVATGWCVFQAARLLFGSWVGALAATVFFLYPAYWTYDLRIRNESLLTLCVTAWLWMSVRCATTPSAWNYGLSGVLGGLTILCKPVLIPAALLLAVLPVIGEGTRRTAWARGAAFVGCLLLVVLPWTVRNLQTFGSFLPVSTGVGAGLWMGSDPELGGSWPLPSSVEEQIWRTAGITPLAYPHVMYEVPVDRLLKEKALARIGADPVGYLRMTASRVVDLWIGNQYYLFNGRSTLREGFLSDAGERGPLVAVYSMVKRLVLVPLILILAAWAAWRHRAAWRMLYPVYALPVGLTLGYIPFSVEAGRYVLPILPCVFLLGVVAVLDLSPRVWSSLARVGVDERRMKVQA
jgi:4-amino-4-deoxy-L-arabinose transferase-like glycosyltransferase